MNSGTRSGGNLFHSFGEFSVPSGGQAVFNNAVDVSNILSRVTGGNASQINGLIQAQGSANLFLINPAGIIFGQGASLSIGGSFYGSTADSILFEDGEFSATDLENPPLLTINAPIGLGFRDEPGDIVNRSVAQNDSGGFVGLSVNQGESISLIGGDVTIENGGLIFAPGGRVELGGLIEAGTVNFNNDNSLTFPEGIARGNVSLTDSSIASVLSDVGGSIGVNAANLELASGGQFVSGIRAGGGSVDAQAGNIVISATDSVLIDGQENNNFTGILANVNTNSIGNAGNINITTGSFTAINSALIRLDSDGQGNAGNLTINATDSVLFDNATAATNVLSSAQNNSDSGNISITTGSLTLDNDSRLVADNSALGTGGDIRLNVTDQVSLNNSSFINVSAAGGGSLTIDARNLELTSDSNIVAGITVNAATSDAQAGDIVINTTEDVLIDAADTESITQIVNSNLGSGNAGNIEVNARNISLINGGAINSFGDGQGSTGNITLNATGNISFDGIKDFQRGGISNFFRVMTTGTPGNIDLKAQNLTLTNGAAILNQITGEANSGDINIDVADTISIDGAGEVANDNTSSFSPSSIASNVFFESIGNSGNININTPNLVLSRNGAINTSIFGQGNAGNININSNLITIGEQGNTTLSPSNIRSNIFNDSISAAEEVSAGSIKVNTDSLFISDGGDISAGISGSGNGGNIKINATHTVSVDGSDFQNE
ncbi:MAG: filamentous hemagglutinin N-terminal domain-containing protein [Hydrococcus sp. SU_1_0]|nr:filamentous hemagglutinin N-terminal domain-containing protein [Hydrococcus sp. SU_1_0]